MLVQNCWSSLLRPDQRIIARTLVICGTGTPACRGATSADARRNHRQFPLANCSGVADSEDRGFNGGKKHGFNLHEVAFFVKPEFVHPAEFQGFVNTVDGDAHPVPIHGEYKAFDPVAGLIA
jgi:hypothetical protein